MSSNTSSNVYSNGLSSPLRDNYVEDDLRDPSFVLKISVPNVKEVSTVLSMYIAELLQLQLDRLWKELQQYIINWNDVLSESLKWTTLERFTYTLVFGRKVRQDLVDRILYFLCRVLEKRGYSASRSRSSEPGKAAIHIDFSSLQRNFAETKTFFTEDQHDILMHNLFVASLETLDQALETKTNAQSQAQQAFPYQ